MPTDRSVRDFAAEVRALIEAEFQPGDAPTAVRDRIFEKLQATDPDLLLGFAMVNARSAILYLLHSMASSARSRAASSAPRSAFHDRVVVGGDVQGYLEENIRYPIDASGAQMPLRLMTADQVRYAADSRAAQGNALLMEAAFLRAVAKRVPAGKTVGDVFDEETIGRLRLSITSRAS